MITKDNQGYPGNNATTFMVIFDWSYTHKSGHLLSNMVIKMSQIFCGYLRF